MKKLVLTDQAKADLAGLDRATRLRIAAALQRLSQASAGNIKKLQGIEPPEYSLRVGDFRVRFSYPDGGTVRVNRVQYRKDSCR
ncbi:MAG: type II toxin-antitoxin system RelE/ParE family toxin [Acidobacteria bacterium]|nr:type II toxin-antitoxin system RelE/ParE family toxin [Acidobacteriota bacterium]